MSWESVFPHFSHPWTIVTMPIRSLILTRPLPFPHPKTSCGPVIAHLPPPLVPTIDFDEIWSPRVKAALNSHKTYHEFLKLVNLFAQDFVDRARIVR